MYTNNSDNKGHSVIPGVKCNVVTCAFNKQGEICQAGTIHVGEPNAESCSDTRCDTFQAK